MRTFLLSVTLCLLVTPMARGDKAPLSRQELEQAADLIVVGRVDHLSINTVPARFEPGHGNTDRVIDLRIRIEVVEKGTWTSDHIQVRSFRAKSRVGLRSAMSPSGHWPIPDYGTQVRAYVCKSAEGWEAVLPNGFSSPDAGVKLLNSQQFAFSDNKYAYFLPIEAWGLLAFLGLAIVVVGMILRQKAMGALRRVAEKG
jgi:hypothetical protein